MVETLVAPIIGVLGTALLAVVGWSFSLGTRVSVIESKHEDLLTLINTRFNEVDRRLGRIEKVMNGHMRESE